MTKYAKQEWLINKFIEINDIRNFKGFFTRLKDSLGLKLLEEFTFYYFGAIRNGWDSLYDFWVEELGE